MSAIHEEKWGVSMMTNADCISTPIPVTREEARFMFIQAGRECDRFDLWRNYEIERDLAEMVGIDIYEDDHEHPYVIAEWCPFNGIHCAWLHHAPPEVLESEIREVEEVAPEWERDRVTGSSLYPDPKSHLGTIRKALDKARAKEKRASSTRR